MQRYAPEIDKRMRPHLKMSGTSYRLDKTYVKVGNEGLVKRLEGRDTIEQPKFAESLSVVAA